MATVDGLTKARMLEIEAESIVDGLVDVNGHLILSRHDATTIDAGSVIGPVGPQGPQGVNPDNTAAWVDYVPVVAGLGAMTMVFGAHTDNHARYLIRGKICFIQISRLYTFGGTMQNSFTFSLPAAAPKAATSPGSTPAVADVQNNVARGMIQQDNTIYMGSTWYNWVAGTYHCRVAGFYELA